MSAGSRSTRAGQHGARGTNAAAWFYAQPGFRNAAFDAPAAAVAGSPVQDEGKAPVVVCAGPTGPCVHPDGIGHAGDHVRPMVHAEPVPARDLAAENAELRSCLLVALPLLRDCEQRRGGFARLGLVARIERAVAR